MCSAISLLMKEIDQTNKALHAGLKGFAEGSSRHNFISSKYSEMGVLKDKLAKYIGEKQAEQEMCRIVIGGGKS